MSIARSSLLAASVLLAYTLLSGCATGRVRGAQGTEMQQEEAYEPGTKVNPPEGNVDRTSGPITLPNPPPVLEVDLERRRRAPGPEPEPEPKPEPKPETGNPPE